jgi:hypothetical protein
MGVGQRLGDLANDQGGLGEVQPLAVLTRVDYLVERLPGDEGAGDEKVRPVPAGIVHGHDVRMPQVGGGPRLAGKPLHALLGGEHLRSGHLQRHPAVQLLVVCLVDQAEATRAQEALDRESADPFRQTSSASPGPGRSSVRAGVRCGESAGWGKSGVVGGRSRVAVPVRGRGCKGRAQRGQVRLSARWPSGRCTSTPQRSSRQRRTVGMGVVSSNAEVRLALVV